MPHFPQRKEMLFSPKVVVRCLRSLIGCSFLRAYWLFLGAKISFINVGLRLCCVLNISVIRSCLLQNFAQLRNSVVINIWMLPFTYPFDSHCIGQPP